MKHPITLYCLIINVFKECFHEFGEGKKKERRGKEGDGVLTLLLTGEYPRDGEDEGEGGEKNINICGLCQHNKPC